ncbi:MAG: PhzF family phenazine biosynthesis protein [Streptosporangiaceae bacterium]
MRMLVVDAFTDRAFAGNPAGVCLLDGPADAGWMQQVAQEMRHSETAFVRQVQDGFELRWFTPVVEVALCGHATLAAAHALFETGLAARDQPIRFHTSRSGVLTVGAGRDGLELDFPAAPAEEIEEPAGLAAALGVQAQWVGRNHQNDTLVLVGDARTVQDLVPDLARLKEIDSRGVCVTAAGGEADFVSRFFAPRVGVEEDPVTGSAHCMLAPFWAPRLGGTALTGHQASARGGFVRVELKADRVILVGTAVTVLDGELRI